MGRLAITLTTCVLIFFGQKSEAFVYQHSGKDSLMKTLDGYAKRDTAYLESLLAVARKMRMEDFNVSESLFVKATELAKKLQNKKKLVESYNGLGVTYGMQDKYPEAILSFKLGLHIALESHLPENAGDSYGSLGIVYKRMGEYPTALAYYNKSLQLYDSLGNKEAIASACHNLGVLFDLMKDPDKATEYYQKSLDWYEAQKDQKHIAALQENMAIIYLGRNEYEDAIRLFKAALQFYEDHGLVYSIVNVRSNIGSACYKMGKYDEAETYLLPALADAEKHRLIQNQAAILYNLAKIKAQQGQHYGSQRLAIQAKVLADSIGSLKLKADAQELLSFVYEKSGDTKAALRHYKDFSSLKDSLFEENKVKSYKNQQVVLEVHEKDKQLEAQTMEMAFLNRQIALENRWKWALGFASFCLFLAGTVYYQKYRQRLVYSEQLESNNSLITRQNEEIEEINLQLEKRMLRAQMNPHFIFNALSSIQHFVIANDKVSALHYLSHFSSMLRRILETSVNVNMALKDEVELIRIYLELESLRFENGFSYEINLDNTLDADMIEIPTMIIQPFVENAILHGLMPKPSGRKLSVDIRDGGAFITVAIADNGVGRKAADAINRKKMGKAVSRGISVTSQRLELLAKKYGMKTDVQYVDLTDEDGNAAGTLVLIQIPKQEI